MHLIKSNFCVNFMKLIIMIWSYLIMNKLRIKLEIILRKNVSQKIMYFIKEWLNLDIQWPKSKSYFIRKQKNQVSSFFLLQLRQKKYIVQYPSHFFAFFTDNKLRQNDDKTWSREDDWERKKTPSYVKIESFKSGVSN